MRQTRGQDARLRRGRAAAVAAAVLAAALVWLVAPALSTQPYLPAAEDFTMPVGDVIEREADGAAALYRSRNGYSPQNTGGARARAVHSHEGAREPIRFRTRPLKAPARFDLVGVAGGDGPYEYRVREEGGPWTDWVATDPGAPVYTGGSDYVQVRSRHAPISGELHFVNVSGDAQPVDRVVNGLRSAINSAVISVAAGSSADAAAGKPKFIRRKQWGANRSNGGCKPRSSAEYGKVKAGVVHHTVSTNTYTRAEAPGVVLAICRFHRNGNGWNDIGYNALVDRFGNVYEGRAGGLRRPVIGAQAEGVNAQTAGVAAIGDYQRIRPPKKTVKGIVKYLAWRLKVAKVRPGGTATLLSSGGASQRTPKGKRVKVPRVFQHGLTNYTSCAGQYLNARIPKIQRQVKRKMRGAGKPPEPQPPEPPDDDGKPQVR